jgi:hypothetical protein
VPRYYFHLHNDLDVTDDEGKELPDLEAAREWAACNAQMVMAQTLKDEGKINFKHTIDIEDEQGAVLATVRFKDSVQVEG